MMYDPELLASVRGQTATHISDGTKSVIEFAGVDGFNITDFKFIGDNLKLDKVWTK